MFPKNLTLRYNDENKTGWNMFVEESEFKGNKMLVIRNDENDRFPFSFGLTKAKKILGALDEIRAFVEKYDKSDDAADQPPPPGAPAN